MDTKPIQQKINNIYEMRAKQILALSKFEAEKALQEFQADQPATPNSAGKYWINRTAQAAARVFSDAEYTKDGVRWFIAHGVNYGVYLELCNDRRHAALYSIITRHLTEFMWKVGELYKDV